MKVTELLRIVGQNINQNKFKSVMTSVGIVAGAATIVMVIGIGRGGKMDIAEQFAQLNAGEINISYEYKGEDKSSGGGPSSGGFANFFSGMFGMSSGAPQFGGGGNSKSNAMMPNSAGFPGSGSFPGRDNASGSEDFSGGGSFPGSSNAPGSDGFPGGGSFPGSSNAPGSDGFPGGGSFPGSSNASGSDRFPGGADFPERSDISEDGTGNDPRSDPGPDGAGSDDAEESEEDGTGIIEERLNQEEIILSSADVKDLKTYISGISDATISYSLKASVEGGNLTSAQTYVVAGVKENYADVSKLTLKEGAFLTEADDELQKRCCVLGASAAKEIFGGSAEAAGSTIYIDDHTYTVAGVFEASSVISSGISADTSIFVPYETGIKYIAGDSIDPVITVIAEDVDVLESVIEKAGIVLEENYSTASFTFEDSGSKMQAAKASNRTLTTLLAAMAAIVFFIGGIGIMNVLFVSIKERTNEIGILKAIGMQRPSILLEFLIESAAISFLGGILGCLISFAAVPLIKWFGIRVECNAVACLAALGFSVLTGTLFGIYPAWKASRMEPVEALNSD